MRILTIGKGAREHAAVSHLARIGQHDLYAAPGNPGIARLAQVHQLQNPSDADEVVALAKRLRPDLIYIGPEDPLCAGVPGELRRHDFATVGPSQAAAQIEASKSFGKQVCERAGILTPTWVRVEEYEPAKSFVLDNDFDVVIKEDGLAQGKGVDVTDSQEEALERLRMYRRSGYFDKDGRLVLERRIQGREVSAHAFTDGEAIIHMPFSCDYKRLLDGDLGPNTGGMGCYCRVPWLTELLAREIEDNITRKALGSMSLDFNHRFSGIFYPGVMVTDEGPMLLEFNARFGDPETCVILALLRSDLAEILHGIAHRKLHEVKPNVRWSDDFAVAVVLASEGYPENPIVGRPISGLEDVDREVQIFHAGTKLVDGKLVTAGGRVLTLVATGPSIEQAREHVYDNVKRVSFEGMHFRTDIAQLN